MLTEPQTPPPRRAIANIAADIETREHTRPGGFEGTDDALRYGADLLGRVLGHAGATLQDIRWYEIYAAAAYDGLNLCPTLHIMAAEAMDRTRTGPPYGDTREERARELTETGTSIRRTGPGILQALREALAEPGDQDQP